MKTPLDKQSDKSQPAAVNNLGQKQGLSTSEIQKTSQENTIQKHRQYLVNNSAQAKEAAHLQAKADQFIQRKENKTGLPDNLKSGIENLSGLAMDDVKVHYNSGKPAQLNAHAYAQGTDIHIASGQEKHLAHEAWHVVQQKQGRVKPTVEMNGGVKVNDDKGLEQEADVMGSKATQLKSKDSQTNKVSTANTKTLQLKEENELKPGGLNMIGETHTDYPTKKARRYEAKQIKAVMGNSTHYFTEGKLKTNKEDKDYSDPVDLRLQQSIAFVKESCDTLIPDLKSLDKGKFDLALQKSNLSKATASTAVEKFAPQIASDEFDKNEVAKKIFEEAYPLNLLKELMQSDIWKMDSYDPDGNYIDNFFDLMDLISEEVYRQEDEMSSDDESQQAPPNLELQKAQSLVCQINGFFDKYKGRLPVSLKLYYNLKKSNFYANSEEHFKFAVGKIPKALEQWDKLEELNTLAKDVLTKSAHKYLPDVIEAAIKRLKALIKILDEGTSEEIDVLGAAEKRSIAMNNAAESLKAKNIAWKVGDLHIKDIKRLENNHTIPETGYTYISKENFKGKYLDEDQLKNYEGDDSDLGDAYLEAQQEVKDTLAQADEKLKNRLPWEDNYDSIKHLDLGNLVTNQTELIVKAVEDGTLPKLKKLTITEASMTPDLRGRLIGCGVEVVLT